MTIEAIDFGLLYQSHLAQSRRSRKSAQEWDSRAEGMAAKALRSGYTERFVAAMDLRDAQSLLDVGCGPGTIGLAVAERLQRVIGLDYSSAMLQAMRQQAAARGLQQVQTLQLAWEDDWSAVPQCDIVVASRSTNVEDIATALAKLHDKARLRVYLTHLVGGHFTDPALYHAMGRRPPPSAPDYIYLLNILHRMGIHPRLGKGLFTLCKESRRPEKSLRSRRTSQGVCRYAQDGQRRAGGFFMPSRRVGPVGAAHGVGNPRKASSLAAVAALCSAPTGPNAISLHSVNRPYISQHNRLAEASDAEDFVRRVAWSAGALEEAEAAALRAWYAQATPEQRAGPPMRWALISWDKPSS
ncbi:class I SAM-dependent methyltransferase [Vandammella animalimorsus]|uniref:class I SAM-dependent methyltransferase n=1 Tax=Vandammella animalimorsus TaxID=2029117 RepID=UPI001EEDBAB2|nr:class I SAM-dependent methyltransferase [Vandammella animalimorsus]